MCSLPKFTFSRSGQEGRARKRGKTAAQGTRNRNDHAGRNAIFAPVSRSFDSFTETNIKPEARSPTYHSRLPLMSPIDTWTSTFHAHPLPQQYAMSPLDYPTHNSTSRIVDDFSLSNSSDTENVLFRDMVPSKPTGVFFDQHQHQASFFSHHRPDFIGRLRNNNVQGFPQEPYAPNEAYLLFDATQPKYYDQNQAHGIAAVPGSD